MFRYIFQTATFLAAWCTMSAQGIPSPMTPEKGGYIRTGNTFSSILRYQEMWNYTTVRPGAHTFWWLYYAEGVSNPATRPLILWLQGGPGASSTGFGNFQEIGPVDTDSTPRDTTWLAKADLVFVDNPVGSGFSYVKTAEGGSFTHDVHEIAADLVAWAKDFFDYRHPRRQQQPFYVFCESYGGKMTAAFAQALYQAMQRKEVTVNFKGITLGDSWISPMDYVNAWPDYLYSFETDGVSWYNVLKRGGSDPWSLATTTLACASLPMVVSFKDPAKCRQLFQVSVNALAEPGTTEKAHKTRDQRSLASFMNGPIRDKLKMIPDDVTWAGQSGEVFSAQYEDFMKPVIDVVDYLLQNTTLHVAVYNGQLDLICATIGTEVWLAKLKWPGIQQYYDAAHTAVRDSAQQTSYFKREYDRFHMYWVMRAGHMAPHDNAEAMDKIVDELISH